MSNPRVNFRNIGQSITSASQGKVLERLRRASLCKPGPNPLGHVTTTFAPLEVKASQVHKAQPQTPPTTPVHKDKDDSLEALISSLRNKVEAPAAADGKPTAPSYRGF